MSDRAIRWRAGLILLAAFALGMLASRMFMTRQVVAYVPDLGGLAAMAHDTDFVAQSKRLIDEKHYVEAVAVCERGLLLDKTSAPLRMNLAVAHLLLGNVGKGESLLSALVAQNPADTLAQNNLRWAQDLRRERETRIEELGRSLSLAALAQARAALQRERADLYARLGDTQRALDDYAALAKLDSNDATAVNNAGVVLMDAGRYDEAEARFRDAARLAPEQALYRNNIQWALRKKAGQ